MPAMAALLFLFFIPMYYTIKLSFFSFSGEYIGLDAYTTAFSDPMIMDSLKFSLYLAAASTLLAAFFAVLISMALRKTFIGKKIAVFMYQLNIPIPYIAFALMMLLLLFNTGYMSRIFFELGLTSSPLDFPAIMFSKAGLGIIITYTLKFIPFIGMSVLAILQTSVPEYEEQAATLGAGRIRTFIHVTLPMILPAVASTTIITFAFAFGTYEIPYLLGSPSPLAMPVLAYNSFISYDMSLKPVSYAIANLMTIVIVAITFVYAYFASKRAVKR